MIFQNNDIEVVFFMDMSVLIVPINKALLLKISEKPQMGV